VYIYEQSVHAKLLLQALHQDVTTWRLADVRVLVSVSVCLFVCLCLGVDTVRDDTVTPNGMSFDILANCSECTTESPASDAYKTTQMLYWGQADLMTVNGLLRTTAESKQVVAYVLQAHFKLIAKFSYIYNLLFVCLLSVV